MNRRPLPATIHCLAPNHPVTPPPTPPDKVVTPSLPVYMTSTWLTMTGLGRPWSGEQMELRGRPNSRPWVGESEVGDRGRPSSCVLEPLQKGQLIRDLFLLKDFCWPGSAGGPERKRWAAVSDVHNIGQWNQRFDTLQNGCGLFDGLCNVHFCYDGFNFLFEVTEVGLFLHH